MLKINKNNIIFKRGVLALEILAFAFLLAPMSAGAEAIHPYQPPVIDHGQYQFVYNNPPTPPPAPVYAPGPVVYTTPPTVVEPAPNVIYAPGQAVDPATTDEAQATDETLKDLSANALYGSNGLAPSGLVQWVLFAILILIIVILGRKIFGADKKYHSTPLKHA